MGIKVSLRKKKISKGRESLYLDFYPAITHPETGKFTRREFLKMYVLEKPKTAIERNIKKETLRTADLIKLKWENKLNKQEVYTEFELEVLKKKELKKEDFVQYYRDLAKKRRSSNYDNWMSALNYLEDFTGGSISFGELNEQLLEEFKEFLLTTKSKRSSSLTLSQNSAVSYFNKIKAALKQAFKDGFLEVDLSSRVGGIKQKETRREFLTKEELNQLAKTPCKYPLIRKVALFSALTGLRFSDIQNLYWRNIEFIPDQGYFIKFRQQKTDSVETHPIPKQAFGILGNPQSENEKIFAGLKYSAYHNKNLSAWVKKLVLKRKLLFIVFVIHMQLFK